MGPMNLRAISDTAVTFSLLRVRHAHSILHISSQVFRSNVILFKALKIECERQRSLGVLN